MYNVFEQRQLHTLNKNFKEIWQLRETISKSNLETKFALSLISIEDIDNNFSDVFRLTKNKCSTKLMNKYVKFPLNEDQSATVVDFMTDYLGPKKSYGLLATKFFDNEALMHQIKPEDFVRLATYFGGQYKHMMLVHKDKQGKTMLHKLKQPLLDTATQISTRKGRFNLFLSQDNEGNTPFFYMKEENVVKDLNEYTSLEAYAICSKRNNKGQSLLHTFSDKFLRYKFLNNMHTEQKVRLLSAQDEAGNTPVAMIADDERHTLVCLKQFDPDDRFTIASPKNVDNENLLYSLTGYGAAVLMEDMNMRQMHSLLTPKGADNVDIFDRWAEKGSLAVAYMVCRSEPCKEREEIIEVIEERIGKKIERANIKNVDAKTFIRSHQSQFWETAGSSNIIRGRVVEREKVSAAKMNHLRKISKFQDLNPAFSATYRKKLNGGKQ